MVMNETLEQQRTRHDKECQDALVLRLRRENAQLRSALLALTEWGCTHTSPLDANSPHELLIDARNAIGSKG